MTWIFEEDVWDFLLERFGGQSLPEKSPAVDEDLLQRLTERALQLGIASIQQGEFTLDADLQTLLEMAARAPILVQIVGDSFVPEEAVSRFYYIADCDAVCVEQRATQLTLRRITRREGIEECRSVLGIQAGKAEERTLIVPCAADGHEWSIAESLTAINQLIHLDRVWWLMRWREGQIEQAHLLATKGSGAWILQWANRLELAPLSENDGEAILQSLLATT